MKQDKTNKTLVQNRQASHEYFILERFEVGMCLTGDEVKSIKSGNANLKEAFIYAEDGGIVIKNMHVSPYEKTDGFTKNSPRRDRKLLMHKQEILKVRQKVEKKGLTLIPLSLYLKGALIKMEVGLCQGKHTYDKKKTLMEKDNQRYMERQIKNYN